MSDSRTTESFRIFGVPFAVTCPDGSLRERTLAALRAFFPVRLTPVELDEAAFGQST